MLARSVVRIFRTSGGVGHVHHESVRRTNAVVVYARGSAQQWPASTVRVEDGKCFARSGTASDLGIAGIRRIYSDSHSDQIHRIRRLPARYRNPQRCRSSQGPNRRGSLPFPGRPVHLAELSGVFPDVCPAAEAGDRGALGHQRVACCLRDVRTPRDPATVPGS